MRFALTKVKGPRIILFGRSGYITLAGNLDIEIPYVTILGQSAPGDGVTIRGAQLGISTHDVVIRYLRFRVGSTQGYIGKCNPKKSDCTLDTVSFEGADNVILDHVSMSWSIDEIFSGADSDRVTLQYSIVADALNSPKTRDGVWLHSDKEAHGLCSLWRGSGYMSFHHNIYANCQYRMPQFSPKGDLGIRGFVANNYIYNYKDSATTWNSSTPGTEEARHVKMAIVNNVYDFIGNAPSRPIRMEPANKVKTLEAYLSGNLGPQRPSLDSGSDWDLVEFRDGLRRQDVEVSKPFADSQITLHDTNAIPWILFDSIGANVPKRDLVDENLFDRIANRESALLEDESDVGGYPELSNEVGAADTDRDGLPNDWEKIHGSDPTRMDSGLDSDGDGYTLLDDYLDEVIADAR